jgi:hypothetical protein
MTALSVVVHPTRVIIYDYDSGDAKTSPTTAHIERPNYSDEDEDATAAAPKQRLLLSSVTFTVPKGETNEDLEQRVAFITPRGTDDMHVQGSGLVNVYSIENDKHPETWLEDSARVWLGTWRIQVSEKGAEAELEHKPSKGEAAGEWAACKGAEEQVTFLLESLEDNDSIRWQHQEGGVVLLQRKKPSEDTA